MPVISRGAVREWLSQPVADILIKLMREISKNDFIDSTRNINLDKDELNKIALITAKNKGKQEVYGYLDSKESFIAFLDKYVEWEEDNEEREKEG